jgi:hypothetical protein
MAKEARFEAAKAYIESGKMRTFRAIFDIIPKYIMAEAMGMNYQTFQKKVGDLRKFTMGDIQDIGIILDTSPHTLFHLLDAEIPKRKTRKGS